MARLGLLLLVMLTIHAESAAGATPNEYCNERFGFCVTIPAGFAAEPPPENGDGLRFTDSRGGSIVVSGINNVFEATLDTVAKDEKAVFDRVTYEKQGENWLVLSGYCGDDILYSKIYVGAGCLQSLRIRHPQALAKEYSSITAEVARSFEPGELAESH